MRKDAPLFSKLHMRVASASSLASRRLMASSYEISSPSSEGASEEDASEAAGVGSDAAAAAAMMTGAGAAATGGGDSKRFAGDGDARVTLTTPLVRSRIGLGAGLGRAAFGAAALELSALAWAGGE